MVELLEAKYTSPSGKEFTFLWEKVSKKTGLKTGIFTFPDIDGAYVQHHGGGPVSFPIACIFNGEDHAKKADAFEQSLLERGTGELQHPIYGIKKVIPTGDISRENDLIKSLNESQISITFTETITGEAVELEAVTADQLEEDYDDFVEGAASDFTESLEIDNIGETLVLQSTLNEETTLLNGNLSWLVASDRNKFADFLGAVKELKDNIKKLLNKTESFVVGALNVARLVLRIMRTPSRAITGLLEKVKGYTQLITQIVNQFCNDPFGINNIKNQFATTRLVLTGAVASIAVGSALNISENASNNSKSNADKTNNTRARGNDVLSRESAMAIAMQIQYLLNVVQTFEDNKIGTNNFIDTNADSYFLLIKLVQNSIKLIQNASFSLPMQQTIKLDKNRNIIELCAELYGSVDNFYIDRLINDNNLNIDEFEIIPMGKEVVYYVQSA